MRRHHCSKCGLAYYSTWIRDNTSEPVTCRACISTEKKALGDHSRRVSPNEISTTLHRGITIREPSQASIVVPDNQRRIQIQDQSRFEPNLELSLSLRQGIETRSSNKEKSSCLWDPRILQKRKRSKLPQYTLSPMERFANQLRQAVRYQEIEDVYVKQGSRWLLYEKPKYDNDFIYEKCNLVSHNEIGLGASLLTPPVPLTWCSRPELAQAKTEPHADEDCASSSVLFDVPIRGFSK